MEESITKSLDDYKALQDQWKEIGHVAREFSETIWERFRAAPWRQVIADALAPITVGLMLAAGYLLTQSADHDWKQYGLSALAVLLLLRTRINPVWMILAGALLGLTGWV